MRSDTVKKGFERAPHRSLLRAVGLTDADFEKPFIGIACSRIDIIPGHVHLGPYAEIAKQEIRAAGGVPFEFNTIGVDDGIAMGHGGMLYSLPSRELIADSVETMMNAHQLDALVCMPNCDKIVPGMLMGALRVDVPTVFVSGGPMKAGQLADGTAIDLTTAFEAVGKRVRGQITDAELYEIECKACPGAGSCSGMFTANSMNVLCEAMGVALTGNGTALALSPEREELVRRAARRAVEIAGQERFRLRRILNAAAVENAFVVDMAMGGSTNTVLHMLAIAREAGVDFDLSPHRRAGAPGGPRGQDRPLALHRAHGGRPPRGRPAGGDGRGGPAGRAARGGAHGERRDHRRAHPGRGGARPRRSSARWTRPTPPPAAWRCSSATWRPRGRW